MTLGTGAGLGDAQPPARGAGVGLLAVTAGGRALAGHLAAAWPGAEVLDGPPRAALVAAWGHCRSLVLFMATGAAVRLVAPLLRGKDTDPGVVSVDDAGRFAVVLLGGHEGGANALAGDVAAVLGATAVVTTASEAAGHPVLAALGADLGFHLDPGSDVPRVTAAALAGERVVFVSELRWPLPALPPVVAEAAEAVPPCVVVSDRSAPVPRPAIVLRPPSLVVGVGCSRGAGADDILTLVDRALAGAGLSAASVAALATVDAKRDEPGLLEAATRRGWPLDLLPADELAAVPVPNPSDAALRAVGTRSVAEAAAIASATRRSAGADLVVAKQRSVTVTAAVARVRPRGRLYLVGAGPGDEALVPPMARDALAASSHVIGLRRYVDAVRPFLRPGTVVECSDLGREEERARRAVALAASGAAVALVSSGDAGVYGMASPAVARAGTDVDLVTVPGVTAAVAAAALLGAPLGHDHCAISLSDLLTPWETIRRRLAAAAVADLVVVLYNPRSRGRDWQLEEARQLLLEHRDADTPVGIVTDAFRPGQHVVVATLGTLDVGAVGMTTTVVVGNASTVVRAGRMVTPRGYGAFAVRAAPAACRTPHPIEAESYRILRATVDVGHLPPLSRAVVERIVHATADPPLAATLVLDEAALAAGRAALAGGAPVVVDARMVAAAITSRRALCALDLEPAASPRGGTRSARAVRAAADVAGPGAVWVVGCAPTALEEVLVSAPAPALVVGLPVGYVGAAEAKEALIRSGLPALTNRGPRGGSAVAAAAVNALLYEGGLP